MYIYGPGCLLPLLTSEALQPFGGFLIGWVDDFSQGMFHPETEGVIFRDESGKNSFWHPQLKRTAAKLMEFKLDYLAVECTGNDRIRIFGIRHSKEVEGASAILEPIILKEISLDIILKAIEVFKNSEYRCSVDCCDFRPDIPDIRHAVLTQDKKDGCLQIYCGRHADELVQGTLTGHNPEIKEIILDGRLIPPRAAVMIMTTQLR